MKPNVTVPVRVSGGRVDRELTTWGQEGIWRWHGNDAPDATFRFPNAEMFPVPAGCTLESLTAALEATLLRRDALRTVIRRGDDGRRWQHTEAEGEVTLAVYEAPADEAGGRAWEIGKELGKLPWSMAEWPMRFAVVGTGADPHMLVVSFNRLALDPPSVVLVAEELLRRASGGEPPAEDAWQPIDEARFEHSAEGAALNDRAMQHYRHVLTLVPPSLFDLPLLEPEELSFRRLEIVSPAFGRAVRWMHRKWRTAPSAVLLAALSVLLGRYTGHRRIALNVMAGNRLDRRHRDLVGTLTGDGLFYLDLDEVEPAFDRLARAAYRASGTAQQFGFCDPESVAALKEELAVPRGAYLGIGAYVNDVSLYDYGEEPEPTAEELRELTARTAIEDVGGMPGNPTGLDIRMHLTVQRDRDMPLTLICDTRYVSVQTMRRLLLAIERTVVGALCGEADVEALCDASGLAPAERGQSWARCDDGWVDLATNREIWRQVAGDCSAGLTAEEIPGVPGEHRLVGQVFGDESTKLDDLHRRCVSALGLRTDVRAPAWYRVLGGDRTVLIEGDGRG